MTRYFMYATLRTDTEKYHLSSIEHISFAAPSPSPPVASDEVSSGLKAHSEINLASVQGVIRFRFNSPLPP